MGPHYSTDEARRSLGGDGPSCVETLLADGYAIYAMKGPRAPRRHLLLSATRLWLPLLIAVAGVVGLVVGHGRTAAAGAGVGLLLVALTVWLINWMYRMSVASNRDRDREEEARAYFDKHGRWPDE
jgi:hypothetical protein